MHKSRWKTFALILGIHLSGMGIASAIYVYSANHWLVSATVVGMSAAAFVVCAVLTEEMMNS